jgi:putative salt-induced outer membrane protein
MNASKSVLIVAALWAVTAVTAQAAWKGKGEAGVVVASGNTRATTLNLKLNMSKEVDKWKHTLDMAALRATTGGSTIGDRYTAGWQSDYKISDRTFAFGALRYENDKFSGFKYQASETAGVGYKIINTEKVKLSGQAGAGVRQLKNAVTGATSSDAVFTAGLDYENQLNASTKVVDKFRAESGSKNTLYGNFIGVEVKMSTALALSVGLDVRSNTKPPAGLKKTDTLTTANLVYSF